MVKLEKLKGKVNLTKITSNADTGMKSKRAPRGASTNSTKNRRVKNLNSFTGSGGATGQNIGNISMAHAGNINRMNDR